ncbi:MAG: polyprenyl synthetase family protein [Dehalococcoidia bacterium]|nr:polyprenyl synthetase family protein [Dehalococcoidia bacterium]
MSSTSNTPLREYGAALQAKLRRNMEGKEGILYQVLAYQMGWADESGSPTTAPPAGQHLASLPLAVCSSLTGTFEQALPSAACMALVDGFIQIHEDVQAGSPQRDGRPSVWWLWGPGQAINAGDGMHALARLSLMDLADQGLSVESTIDGLRLLDQSCLELCEGQHLDLSLQDRANISTDLYLKMASSKTGAIVSCGAALGAVAADADAATINGFREFGRSLGVAVHIIQDIEMLWPKNGNGEPSDRLLGKKKLFPVVHIVGNGDAASSRELDNIYRKRVLEPDDIARVLAILDSVDARSQSLEVAAGHYSQAESCLASLTMLGDPQSLRDVAHHITLEAI